MRDAFIARRDYILMEHLQVVEGGRQQWHIQRDGEGVMRGAITPPPAA